jgi:hypothetical protein
MTQMEGEILKLVYICSPLHGDIKNNIRKADEYCVYALRQGVIPLAPHTVFTRYLDDNIPEQRQRGVQIGIELLRRCDELWVFGKTVSPGMTSEINTAQVLKIPIRCIPETEIQMKFSP